MHLASSAVALDWEHIDACGKEPRNALTQDLTPVPLQKLIEALFHEAVRRMVAAFEARAHDLYGTPAAVE